MKITIMIPCHNEEKSIRACVQSCLIQTRTPDQVLVINDGSTDKSGEILAEFGDQIQVLTIPVPTGNKSRAQERGLPYVIGDVVITTDGDTLLNPTFVQAIEKEFENERVAAVSGCVKSLPYNWLTACRAFEYTISHNIHKVAQSYLNYIFVISGAAGAFRTDVFRDYLTFEHDTITEDLDFTYKLHKAGFIITYTRDAVSYTQDPTALSQYINQMRRWYGGGWQNLKKHYVIVKKPVRAFELSLLYFEGLLFSALLLSMPFVNLYFSIGFLCGSVVLNSVLAIYAAIIERRWDMFAVPIVYPFIVYLNGYIFLEQGFREIVMKRNNLVWFSPRRVSISESETA